MWYYRSQTKFNLRMISLLTVLSVLGVFFTFTQTTTAVPLTLFNTGLDAGGTVLAGAAGNLDAHYTVDGPGPGGAIAATVMTKHSAWVAAPAGSQWIGISDVGQTDLSSPGDYAFDITFEIGAGLNASTAVVTGKWATDNTSEIYLNGVATGLTNPSQFSLLESFTLNSGFVSGTNTLTFLVTNLGGAGNPMGLLVADLQGQAVPEPSTYALFALGLAALGYGRRKKA